MPSLKDIADKIATILYKVAILPSSVNPVSSMLNPPAYMALKPISMPHLNP
jgi:hypothetical protein